MKPIILLEQIIDPYTRDNDKSKTTPAKNEGRYDLKSKQGICGLTILAKQPSNNHMRANNQIIIQNSWESVDSI